MAGSMPNRPRAAIAWSSGKDSAFAAHVVRESGALELAAALTTLTDRYERVSMHGVRETLLDLQLERCSLSSVKVRIPAPCPNPTYEREMQRALEQLRQSGITHVVFGDLFLEDIRAYREAQLARVGMHAVFPLWGRDTRALAREMLGSGLDALVTCVDPRVLDRGFAGRRFDAAMLDELPAAVDPCGENGEFHTVVVGGPMFARPIGVEVGELVEREGFVFADVRPVGASGSENAPA